LVGRCRRKRQRWLNLTELQNGSSLNPCVESTSVRSHAQLGAAPFRTRPAQPRHFGGSSARARRGISDAPGRLRQCGRSDSGYWILRAVSYRYRAIDGVAHHGTVPALP
jgi:hypothetical protein